MKVKKCFYNFMYYIGAYTILDKIFDIKGIYIFCYHRLCDEHNNIHNLAVSKSNFIKHITYLKKKYELISMDDALNIISNKEIHKKYAVITFDDGYGDNYTIGYNIFKTFNVNPTIYLTGSNIDVTKMLWTEEIDNIVWSIKGLKTTLKIDDRIFQYSLTTNKERSKLAEDLKEHLKYMKMEEIKERILNLARILNVNLNHMYYNNMLHLEDIEKLKAIGAVFGCHTMNHCNLGVEPESNLDLEIIQSKKLIEDKISGDIIHFSYPYGYSWNYSEKAKEYVRNNYKTSVTVNAGINTDCSSTYLLKRIVVDNISVKYLKMRVLKNKIKCAIENR
jgi:peptidoglycan/xylan/chitin deacetylase (PgdA/CDA1 family)